MARLNLNKLAKTITEQEGGAVSTNIAQVKEVIRLTLEHLAKLPGSEALACIEAYAPHQHVNG